ncbi:MAG: FAD-dependent monooxygenase [Chitinophaga sp.]|uniref:FAD-dependent monooxygenase n=1 Tax=Chitinophaga sp. TaxID=1869181 RepID=UPI001B0796EF|nr:FAD-dependent monooxygenase [Chitinophaga sp.]MBO9730229.1 FAD-dependent monooxygenase [Chitinophaga sp.]
MKTKHILISGASIAGPALAYWLHRYGFQVTIVERAPHIRPGGYAVDFRGAAMQVLDRMDLTGNIRQFETRSGKISIVNKRNKEVARMPDSFTSGELEILRGDLANVFYEATRHDVEYIFDNSITAIAEDATGATVTFLCGNTRRFDIVVGADGLHSKVRSIAFGEESQFSHHLGIYFAIFTVPNFMQLQNMAGLFYSSLGKRIGVFSAREDKEARASLYFSAPAFSYSYRDTKVQQQIIRERFANDEWVVPQLLEYMDQTDDFYFDAACQIKMDSWSSGRVTLMGDAAHCSSPLSGMGTSMAVVGAYVLAGELKAASGEHTVAFARYEAQMRDFVTAGQKMADGADWFVPSTPFKLWMSEKIWKILPYTPWKNMMIEMPMKVANSITLKQY